MDVHTYIKTHTYRQTKRERGKMNLLIWFNALVCLVGEGISRLQ